VAGTAALAAAIGVAGCTAIFVWALPRGFDLLDEAFYLLGYARPEDVSLSLTQFHRVIGRFPGLGGLSVMGYRLLAFGTCAVSGAVLGLAAERAWFAGSRPTSGLERSSVALLGALGGLAYFCWGPRSLSYNTLNGALCALEIGAVLLLASRRPGGGPSPLACALGGAAVGFLLGTHLFVKAPPALLMGIALLGLTPLAMPAGRRRPAFLAGLTLGVLVFPVWFFSSVESPSSWLGGLAALRGVTAHFYGLESVWTRSLRPLLGPVARTLAVGIPCGALVLLAAGVRQRGRGARAALLEGGALTIAVGAVLLTGSWRGGSDGTLNAFQPHVLAGCLALAAWIGGAGPAFGDPRRSRLWVVAVLLLMPLVASLGTGNLLLAQALFHLAAWYVLLGILLLDLQARVRSLLPVLLPPSVALLVFTQVQGGQVRAPYGIREPMTAQTERIPSRVAAVDGIRVGPVTARQLSAFLDLLEAGGFRPGDPIWGMYDFPGIVYLAGGRAPMTPWLFRSADWEPFGCLMLQRAPRKGAREFLLLSREPTAYVRECLARSGRPLDEAVTLGFVPDGPEGPVRVVLLPARLAFQSDQR
jgi:hypothetical protein